MIKFAYLGIFCHILVNWPKKRGSRGSCFYLLKTSSVGKKVVLSTTFALLNPDPSSVFPCFRPFTPFTPFSSLFPISPKSDEKQSYTAPVLLAFSTTPSQRETWNCYFDKHLNSYKSTGFLEAPQKLFWYPLWCVKAPSELTLVYKSSYHGTAKASYLERQ